MGAMACETGGAKRARWGHDGGATVLPSGASEAAQCRCARRLLLPLRSLAAFATRRFSPRGSAVGIAGRRCPTARRVAVNRSETQRAAALAPRAGCAAPCAARAARGRSAGDGSDPGRSPSDDRRERPSRAQAAVGGRRRSGSRRESLRGISAVGGRTRSTSRTGCRAAASGTSGEVCRQRVVSLGMARWWVCRRRARRRREMTGRVA